MGPPATSSQTVTVGAAPVAKVTVGSPVRHSTYDQQWPDPHRRPAVEQPRCPVSRDQRDLIGRSGLEAIAGLPVPGITSTTSFEGPRVDTQK